MSGLHDSHAQVNQNIFIGFKDLKIEIIDSALNQKRKGGMVKLNTMVVVK